jgi:hypothetical protein
VSIVRPRLSPTPTAAVDTTPVRVSDVVHRDVRAWLWLAIGAALLSGVGNVISLIDIDRYYGSAADDLLNQAVAQDLVNLFVVAPLTVTLAWLAARESVTAFLLWFGFVGFTVYNYVIYAFAVPFGPLFLVWVAVLGASSFAMVGAAFGLDVNAVANAMRWRPHRTAAVVLVFASALFAMTWLADISKALQAGEAPATVSDLHLPTNPVHVLDLAFLLPMAVLAGVSLWQRKPFGYASAGGVLTLMGLTGLPIVATVIVSATRDTDATWSLVPPIAALSVVCFVLALAVTSRRRTAATSAT